MKTESTLQEWQRYEKLMLENISDVVITTDLHFKILFWNKIAEEFYGMPVAEAIGKKLSQVIHMQFNGFTLEEAIKDLQASKIWQGEITITNRYNQTYYFLQTVRFALDDEGNAISVLATGRNITDRKLAEKKLLESEQFYRTLIADSLDITLLVNASGEIIFSTPSIKRLLGFELDEVIHTSAFAYVHPEDFTWAHQSFEKEIEENPEVKFIVVRLKKKTGEWLWCMVRGHNLLSVPYVNAIVIYIHDDTPRRKAMEALKKSEKRFRTLIRDLQIGVLLQDAEGKIEMTNAVMCRLFDVSEAEVLGGKIWELYTDVIHEDGTPFLQNERPSFKAMQSLQLVKDVVMGVWHKARKERLWIMVSSDPVVDEAGLLTNIVCSFTDITDRKKAERKSLFKKVAHQRQLAQATIDGQEAERLEIGKELHDNIGQQLTTIKLFLDVARSGATTENAEMIKMALNSVANLINEVRSMSRSLIPPSLKDLGIIDSVTDLVDSLRSTQAISIELDYLSFDEATLPENKKLALFRIVQEQLNNIIKHAGATKVTISLRSAEKGVWLQIADDGVGFEWSEIRKGLGLTNIANRAELFGGKAKIITAPGQGCTVEVFLPHTFAPVVPE